MSELVILYSSHPLSWKEFSIAIQVAGEGNIENEGSQLTGAMWNGDRAIFLYGDWVAPNSRAILGKRTTKAKVFARD